MTEIDKFYHNNEEPIKGCLLALKDIIHHYNPEFESKWYYRLPCFIYKKQIFCYLWIDKKKQFPYIAIGNGVKIDHPDLIQGSRTFVKLLMINPNQDIPVEKIYSIFDMAIELYQPNS